MHENSTPSEIGSATSSPALPTLLVDSRESRSEVPSWLIRLGIATASTELQVGDYHAPGHVIIERKVNSDFMLSLMDGRLFGQAELLANHDDRAIIVIEGSLADVRSEIAPEAIAGALSALAMYFGLSVLPTVNAEQTARVIGRLLAHRVTGLGYDIPMRVAKPKVDGALSQYLLEGLPGIGPGIAQRLLQHFGSAHAVFNASEAELQGMKGIGKKTAEGILRALHHRPTAMRSTKGPAPSK